MTDRETSQGQDHLRRTVKRAAQVFVVLAALVVAITLVAGSDSAPTLALKFNMLGYLDARVASQENIKDVRCWSSFCKLQMFLTGVQIEPEAIAVRIDRHMKLIESIWDEACAQSPNQSLIRSASVSSVLERRFPHVNSDSGATFSLGNGLEPIIIVPEAIQDYSDTIESWRLLQAWASRHTDSTGRLALKQQFDKEVLHVLYNFFGTYDLAILKHARLVAQEKKLASIDAAAMFEAFDLESKLQR